MREGFGLLVTDVMPIFMIIGLDIIIAMRFSINCSTVICLPTLYFLSREKPLVKIMAPGSIFYHIIFRSIISKTQKIPCCTFSLIILFCVFARSICPMSYNLIYICTVERLTTPLARWVASICSLCAGTVYIVLLGSATGLIPWFHN